MPRPSNALGRLSSLGGLVPSQVHGHWPDWLVWEHVAGHAMVWIACIAVPVMIWRLGAGRSEWSPLRGVIRTFALFIGLYGLGHFLAMLSFFRPMHGLSGHVLVITGAFSAWAVWSLHKAWPALLAMRNPAELERVIAERTAELTRALEDLKCAEVDRAYLATLVESTQDAIVGKDLDGVITSWNAGATRIFGYSAAEAIGRPITLLIPPDRLGEEAGILERLRRGEKVDHFESVRITRLGRPIDVALTISPIMDPAGRILGISKIARDITERKQAEATRKQDEDKFRLLAESIPQLTWMARADGHVCWYNQRWYDFTGTTPEEMEGWGWQSVHDPQVLPAVVERWSESIASGEPFDMTFPLRGADGRYREFLTRVEPTRGGDGEVLGWFGTCTDVDEQKQADERLKASERLYRAIGESIPFGVWICDANGRNIYVSESFLRLVGMTQEQCSEFGWSEILHPDDAERTIEAWKECVRTEGVWDIEHRFLGTDGQYHPILARGVPVRDDDGRIVRWAGINLDISRLKKVERALREAEERQRRALTAARLAHWEWEIAADRITYQDSIALLYGRPDDQPFANFSEYLGIVHPDDRDLVREAARRALTPGAPYEVEYRVIWPDGSVRWLAGRGGIFFDDAGVPARMVGVNLDITERKESESQIRLLNESLEQRVRERTAELAAANDALREGGLRFQAIFEAAFQFIGLLSPDGTLLEANRTALEFGGLERDDVVGRPFWEAPWWTLKHETQDRLKRAIQRAAAGQFVRYEADVVGAEGEVATIDFSLKPIHDESGRVTLLIPEGRVVTEQKRAAETLRRSLAALRESQRLAGVGSWEWDPVADVVTWSDELYRIAGRDPALPPPRYAEHDQIYTPESLALLRSVVARTLEIGEPYEVELEMIRGDGPNHWIIARGEAIRDASGRVVRLQGTSQDITERRLQREELRRARDQAVAAMGAKGDFLANMSHEIRTPMNGVVGMTELLLDTQLNDLQRRYAETIRTSGEALMTVIDDILDFSKIEAGKLKIEAVDLDLRTVMEEVVDLLAPSADRKGIEIRCRVAPAVPGRLVGDPVRIRQVLTNLVGNAVKFTDRGTVDLEAELLADDGRIAGLRILVRDTGIGIPEDRQAEIFDSFTQVDGGSSRSHGGTGLGLAICQNLARLMGGRIGVESRPGAGSTFWFEVSLGKGEGDPDVAAAGLRGLRVLVVDDEEANRVILREILHSWECRPELADSGAEALARLMAADGAGEFGLILLDQKMPGMDGVQLARVIRSIPRHADIPLVLLSSLSSAGEGEEVEPGLWAARLTKPIRRSQLYNILRRVVFSPDSLRAPTGDFDDGRMRLPAALNILLAEDSEINRTVAIGLAERLGCVVESVGNGREAIEAIGRGRYDVVLMDVQMPELDGLDAATAIRALERESGRHIPIIALTAHAMQGDRERCLAAGMDGYLTKPLKLGPLREALLAWGFGIGRETSEEGGRPGTAFRPNSFGALEKLFGANPKLIRDVLEIMLRDVPLRLRRLEKAINDRDGHQICWEAHGLKGAFLTVGASALAAACQELITLGERGDFDAMESVHHPIRNQWERLALEATRHLEMLGSTVTVSSPRR